MPKGGSGLRAPTPPPLPAPLPARMSASEFDALRPQLAALMGISVSAVPVKLVPAANLNTVGNSMVLAAASIPADCGLRAIRASFATGKIGPYSVGQAYCLWDPPATGQEWFDLSLPIPGPGIYVFTLRADSSLANLPISIGALGSAGLTVESSGPLPVQLKNGKLLAVFEVTKAASYLHFSVDVKSMVAAQNNLSFRSCEVSRLK